MPKLTAEQEIVVKQQTIIVANRLLSLIKKYGHKDAIALFDDYERLKEKDAKQ